MPNHIEINNQHWIYKWKVTFNTYFTVQTCESRCQPLLIPTAGDIISVNSKSKGSVTPLSQHALDELKWSDHYTIWKTEKSFALISQICC
jgi:hypothetical protein